MSPPGLAIPGTPSDRRPVSRPGNRHVLWVSGLNRSEQCSTCQVATSAVVDDLA